MVEMVCQEETVWREREDHKENMQGPPGPQGQQGPTCRRAGVTYIRWEKLLYAGRAGGNSYNNQGGGAEKLCLPLDPDYINVPGSTSASHYSTLHGAECQTYTTLADK